jgi:hypothetical protein
MPAVIDRLLEIVGLRPQPEGPVAIASQSDWYEASLRSLAAESALNVKIAKEHHRVAQLVSAWATTTVSQRHRATFPRVVGSEGSAIAAWLPGLTTAEIMKIKDAPVVDIDAHLFTENPILGVRAVQPLPETPLFWPRPKLKAEGDEGRR